MLSQPPPIIVVEKGIAGIMTGPESASRRRSSGNSLLVFRIVTGMAGFRFPLDEKIVRGPELATPAAEQRIRGQARRFKASSDLR
jgi:hypothetical protein